MKWCLGVTMAVLLFAGCRENTHSTAQMEQSLTEENQKVLLKNQPPVKLKWSLERENLNNRANLWNDPAKVSYIYLVSFGKVMAFYPLKGKVSSVNSQVTNPSQLSDRWITEGVDRRISGVLPSPAEDGSYGTNGDAVFFFTTGGTYVEWRGDYMLCDKPLKLSTPPALILEVKD